MINKTLKLVGVSLAVALNSHAEPEYQDRSNIPLSPIGKIQGSLSDQSKVSEHISPFNQQTVRFKAVLYQKLIWPFARDGLDRYAYLLQAKKSDADNNPHTSEGIFIYTSKSAQLKTKEGAYEPKIGDYLEITGNVSCRYGNTEIREPQLESILETGLDINRVLNLVPLNIPNTKGAANRYFKRNESMRCVIPAGSIIIGPRKEHSRSGDVMLHMILPTATPAQAQDPFARRVFRDPHPLDDIPERLFDNENKYRFVLSSMGLRGTANDSRKKLYPGRTFDETTQPVYGGITYNWKDWKICVEKPLKFKPGINPAQNNPPKANAENEFSIATYNVQNLYDYENDPYDPCDFRDDEGINGLKPPFDYAAFDATSFQLRINKLARHIHEVLHNPNLILLQELEDQDIFSNHGRFERLEKNNADGQNDAAQRLAIAIKELGGPDYIIASDRDAADDRGIITAFMYRQDSLELLKVNSKHPIFGEKPEVNNPVNNFRYNKDVENPKAFNGRMMSLNHSKKDKPLEETPIFSRAVQVVAFNIKKAGKKTLYALNNHFSSRPDSNIDRRTEQAALNARIVRAIQAYDIDALIVMGGDLNVYPRPDEPLPEQNTDQLKPLYDANLLNVYDALITHNPSGAYSYVYKGQAQTLDHLFLSPSLFRYFTAATVAHLNADHSMASDNSHYYGASDHDPIVVKFKF